MKNNFIKIILFTLCFFLSCEHSSSQGKEKKTGFKKNQNTLKIVSWNVQTFFDAVDILYLLNRFVFNIPWNRAQFV